MWEHFKGEENSRKYDNDLKHTRSYDIVYAPPLWQRVYTGQGMRLLSAGAFAAVYWPNNRAL